jgi:ubiquinone/menaquinone biosynthesis C-methylase UbiE
LPFDDASVGAVLSFIKKVESFGDQLVAEINRVLKARGIVLVQSLTPSSDQKVIHFTVFACIHCLVMSILAQPDLRVFLYVS